MSPSLSSSLHSLVTTAYLPWVFILVLFQSQSRHGAPTVSGARRHPNPRDPNFKLHTASFSEVPKVCTEWRDPGDGLDAYQHVEDTDSESKRRYVEY